MYYACNLMQFLLEIELRQLSEKQKVPVDLDTYIKKLANSRKRVLLVNDILHNVQVLYSIRSCEHEHIVNTPVINVYVTYIVQFTSLVL